MSEEKILSTQLVVIIIGNNISIRSYYNGQEVDINTLAAFISETVQIVESVNFKEGELGIQMTDKYPNAIDYTLDSNGNLIVFGDDAEKYSIDDTGSLIYTE
jgi:hypothetical protein